MRLGSLELAVSASVVALGASYALTRQVLKHATRRKLLDVPNRRSSHTVATPRGGGLAVVLVVLAGTLLLRAAIGLPPGLAPALLVGGSLVAAVGWVDDVRGLPVSLRLAAHFAAACWCVWSLGGVSEVRVGVLTVHFGAVGGILAVVAMVWLTNLYNFMDGIDGLAATEAVCVSLVSAGLFFLGGDQELAVLALVIAGAAGGFLIWNWSPAKIFMGDVGSGFIGYLFATIALASERTSTVPLLVWIILLLGFVGDATLTLCRRFVARQRWYTAHRTHAYQRAALAADSHAKVVRWIIGLNAVLGGLAFLAWRTPTQTLSAVSLALAIVLLCYLSVELRHPFASTKRLDT